VAGPLDRRATSSRKFNLDFEQRLEALKVAGEERAVRGEVAAAEAKAALPDVFLPEHKGGRGIAPAPLLWSALFGVLPRGRRERLEGATLAVQGEYQIVFTGQRLGQDDLSIWFAVMNLAQDQPLGASVCLRGSDVLAVLGLADRTGAPRAKGTLHGNDRGSGAGARERIEVSLRRLVEGTVELHGPGGAVFMGHLVESARRGRTGNPWRIRLSRDLAPLFTNVVGLDLRLRRALRGKPLALWLHAWIASHQGRPHSTRIKTLQQISGSSDDRLWRFRQSLRVAMRALEEVVAAAGGELAWKINDRDQLTVSLHATTATG
jgi:hypothetical protein